MTHSLSCQTPMMMLVRNSIWETEERHSTMGKGYVSFVRHGFCSYWGIKLITHFKVHLLTWMLPPYSDFCCSFSLSDIVTYTFFFAPSRGLLTCSVSLLDGSVFSIQYSQQLFVKVYRAKRKRNTNGLPEEKTFVVKKCFNLSVKKAHQFNYKCFG